jgi:molybdenum cofactor cytidylyltransferase
VALIVSDHDPSTNLAADVEALRLRLAAHASTLRWDDGHILDAAGLSGALRSLIGVDLALIVLVGGSVTDPEDAVLQTLEAVGGRIDQLGLACQPGTASWIGHLGNTPVLGLPSSGLLARRGPLDLLLPWCLTGTSVTPRLLGRLAHGGLLAATMVSTGDQPATGVNP